MLGSLSELTGVLKGSYVFNIICNDDPDIIYGIRKDSPLIVGLEDNENILASDIPTVLHVTNKYVLLDNHDIVKLTNDKVLFYNRNLEEIKKEVKEFNFNKESISKNGYDYFMLKEINEEAGFRVEFKKGTDERATHCVYFYECGESRYDPFNVAFENMYVELTKYEYINDKAVLFFFGKTEPNQYDKIKEKKLYNIIRGW